MEEREGREGGREGGRERRREGCTCAKEAGKKV